MPPSQSRLFIILVLISAEIKSLTTSINNIDGSMKKSINTIMHQSEVFNHRRDAVFFSDIISPKPMRAKEQEQEFDDTFSSNIHQHNAFGVYIYIYWGYGVNGKLVQFLGMDFSTLMGREAQRGKKKKDDSPAGTSSPFADRNRDTVLPVAAPADSGSMAGHCWWCLHHSPCPRST